MLEWILLIDNDTCLFIFLFGFLIFHNPVHILKHDKTCCDVSLDFSD